MPLLQIIRLARVSAWERARLRMKLVLGSRDPDAIRTARIRMTGLLIVGYGIVAAYAFVNAVEDSPLVPSFRSRANITTMLPEGWAFFTRNPREPQWFAYSLSAKGWARVEQRHASSVNYFGFARRAPLQMMELGALISQSADTSWMSFPADTDPLQVRAPALTVHNPSVRPILCGDVLVVEREPVPWAWSSTAASVRLGGRILRMSVDCNSTGPDQQVDSPEHARR